MAVDISSEQVVSLTEATNHIPRRRQGKKCSVVTLYRWSQVGVHGIRLETLLVGATRCTSLEALQRFFDALTAQAAAEPVSPLPRQTLQHRKQIEAAERRLAVRGPTGHVDSGAKRADGKGAALTPEREEPLPASDSDQEPPFDV